MNRRFVIPLLVILGVLTVSGIGAAIHARNQGKVVARGIEIGDQVLSGLTPSQARSVVQDRGSNLLDRRVTLEVAGRKIDVRLGDIGFSYDVDATLRTAVSERHAPGPWGQFVGWIESFISEDRIPETWNFDAVTAQESLEQNPDLIEEPALEAEIDIVQGRFQIVTPPRDGSMVDIGFLMEALDTIDLTRPPELLHSALSPLPVLTPLEDVQGFVKELNERTEGGLRLVGGGQTPLIAADQVRRLINIDHGTSGFAAQFNIPALHRRIELAFLDPIGHGEEPHVEIVDDHPVVASPGRAPDVCCDPGTTRTVADAVLSGIPGPFVVRGRPEKDEDRLAWFDGSLIIQQVSEFTTPHRCCEGRVNNIQLMADMVRGVYLIPGERISLNEFIGPRTREAGFVAAGAIRAGRLTPEVGGGVSQFATTIFNAAYFAGLDLVDYQSHSLYFSRYPYGREATISNPAPDLAFRNRTDHPVLIWTSYTDTSITVSMWSTPNVIVEELGRRVSKRRQCTHVETDRKRTFSDGRVEVDTIVADYRPAEGLDCNGNEIPPPPG